MPKLSTKHENGRTIAYTNFSGAEPGADPGGHRGQRAPAGGEPRVRSQDRWSASAGRTREGSRVLRSPNGPAARPRVGDAAREERRASAHGEVVGKLQRVCRGEGAPARTRANDEAAAAMSPSTSSEGSPTMARPIGRDPMTGINARLLFLSDVGLNYLTLSRAAGTLSGGEAQRIRQIGRAHV